MTSATTTARAGVAPPGSSTLRLAPARRRRRPRLLAGSLVLLTACTALFVSAYLRAGHEVEVLAVARAVPQGADVTAEDLMVVRISPSGGLDPVPASSEASVIGHPVSVPLVPGTLLTESELTSAPGIAPDEAIVGVALKPGQMPAGGVSPGERVDVILTGSPGTPEAGASPPALSATVLAPGVLVTAVESATSSSGSDTTVVSLVAPRDEAGVIASASDSGQVALVVVGGR